MMPEQTVQHVPVFRPENTDQGQAPTPAWPIYCPSCGTQIVFHVGLCGNRLLDAIRLQAQRLGSEICCQSCASVFIYQPVETLTDSQPDISRGDAKQRRA